MILLLPLLLGLGGCGNDPSKETLCFGFDFENGQEFYFSIYNQNQENLLIPTPDGSEKYAVSEMSFYALNPDGSYFDFHSPPASFSTDEGVIVNGLTIKTIYPKSYDVDTTYYYLELNEIDTDTLGFLFKATKAPCLPYEFDRFFYNGEEFFPTSTNYPPHLIFIKR